jgi:hypothetical protein
MPSQSHRFRPGNGILVFVFINLSAAMFQNVNKKATQQNAERLGFH